MTEKLEIERAHLKIKLQAYRANATKTEKRLAEIEKQLNSVIKISFKKPKDIEIMDKAGVRF